MSPRFSLQKPYVVATLPRPIDQSTGRYVVGEVHGGTPGSRKRKRSELVVGVDGEGVNIYDISSSKLITSYALPPQCSFTCPPCSLRLLKTKETMERTTYVSIKGGRSQIVLFRDTTDSHGITQTSTVAHSLEKSEASVVFIETITAARYVGSPKQTGLVVVAEDGKIQCLNGESLEEIWTSSTSALWRDTLVPEDTTVEFVHLTKAFAVSQGVLKDRQDLSNLYPQDLSEETFNPDVLIMITKSNTLKSIPFRTMHVIFLPHKVIVPSASSKYKVDSLCSMELPVEGWDSPAERASFSINVTAGTLYQLANNVLTTFDLKSTLPRQSSRLSLTSTSSFLRLSSTSIIASSKDSITVYNPKFRSVMASLPIDDLEDRQASASLKRKRSSFEETEDESAQTCDLVNYFPKIGVVMAIMGSNLVAIQVESQPKYKNAFGATGLLIDSLGCSIPSQARPGRMKKESTKISLNSMRHYLPGSIGSAEVSWSDQIQRPETLLSEGDIPGFESYLLEKFGENPDAAPLTNGFDKSHQPQPSLRPTKASDVDRRWIQYAIRKIFSLVRSDDGSSRLVINFYPHDVFVWLMSSGNITVSNIDTALKYDHGDSFGQTTSPGALVNALIEIDPEMQLLLGVLSNNFLGAHELLRAIRELMGSLGLFADNASSKPALLTNGEVPEPLNGNLDKEIEKVGAEAEEELKLAEYHLGPGSGVRGQALSLALSKLYTCPSHAIVRALQTGFPNQEIVSIIYLLRVELVRGAWTSRYLDIDETEQGEESEISDNAIVLLSSLLNNCIDAIGAGGWLSGDARLVNGDHYDSQELITSLKLEVSAALDGIEEAVYLKGLISEMIKFSDAVQKGLQVVSDGQLLLPAAKSVKSSKPIIMPSSTQESTILPMGLKAEQQISLMRVGAGGEIQRRSARDIGRLKSQKIGKYSLERIVV